MCNMMRMLLHIIHYIGFAVYLFSWTKLELIKAVILIVGTVMSNPLAVRI